jgi:hypothetical protein
MHLSVAAQVGQLVVGTLAFVLSRDAGIDGNFYLCFIDKNNYCQYIPSIIEVRAPLFL